MTVVELQDLLQRLISCIGTTSDDKLKAELSALASVVITRIQDKVTAE